MQQEIFSGELLVKKYGPVVYIWSRGNDTLYVGLSLHGISRPFSSCHHIIGVDDHVLATDSITILYCDSAVEAQDLEGKKIMELNPIYNKCIMQEPSEIYRKMAESRKEYKIFPKRSQVTKPCKECNKDFIGDAGRVYCSIPCTRKGLKKKFYVPTRTFLAYAKERNAKNENP